MKVAIVGAGLSGLITLKECLAEDISADVFEASDHIGGQWAYREPDPETGAVASSVYQGVVCNSCRDTTAFSDFPCDPSRYAEFLPHHQYLQYINEYADFFDLKRHVKLHTKVRNCKQLDDGTWVVEREQGTDVTTEIYDAVFACTGHYSNPITPNFPGKESFKGEFMHSHFYRSPGRFEGKRVAIIGLGSSAIDITCELSGQAKEIHIISRRGAWIIPRYVFGKPAEYFDSRLTQTILPKSVGEWGQKLLIDFVLGKHPPELKPDHRILAAHPTVRGDFIEKHRLGLFKIHRAGVENITPTSIVTSTGETLDVDVIICCTGYSIDYPYLPTDTYRPQEKATNSLAPSNALNLYELIHPVNYTNLYFMGLVDIPGPLAPVVEVQARWSLAVLSGKIRCPTPEELSKGVAEFQADQRKNFVHSDRHVTAANYLPYCDRLASKIGATPTFGRLFAQIFTSGHPLRSFRILNYIYNSVPISSQYRLFGYGSNPSLAIESILRINGSNKGLSKKEAAWVEGAGKAVDSSSNLV